MVRDFLDAIRAGDASEAKTWFQTMFYKQLSDKMDEKKDEVRRSIGQKLSGNNILAQDD